MFFPARQVTPRVPNAILWVGCILAALPVAQAFASAPAGTSIHDAITWDGAMAAGFTRDAAAALQEAVRKPDLDEMRPEPRLDQPGRIDATDRYDPSHHCERVPPATDADSFRQCVAYIASQRDEAARHLQGGDGQGAMAALGRALHAAQDCWSHSNAVDLPAEAKESLRAVLFAGSGEAPGLRLTAFKPGAEHPDEADGDAYHHKGFAKDEPHQNDESSQTLPDGRTKHQAAREEATDLTKRWLERFLEAVPAGHRELLMGTEPSGIPGPLASAALICLAGAGLCARSRWSRGDER